MKALVLLTGLIVVLTAGMTTEVRGAEETAGVRVPAATNDEVCLPEPASLSLLALGCVYGVRRSGR